MLKVAHYISNSSTFIVSFSCHTSEASRECHLFPLYGCGLTALLLSSSGCVLTKRTYSFQTSSHGSKGRMPEELRSGFL